MFFLLSGIQTSTSTQPAFAQSEASHFEGGEPVIPPLTGHHRFRGNAVEGPTRQHLDGAEYEDDSFTDVTFEYSGGAFTLKECSFSGPVRLELKGAALNALALLQFFSALEASRKPAKPPLQMPKVMPYSIAKATVASLDSPYGQR